MATLCRWPHPFQVRRATARSELVARLLWHQHQLCSLRGLFDINGDLGKRVGDLGSEKHAGSLLLADLVVLGGHFRECELECHPAAGLWFSRHPEPEALGQTLRVANFGQFRGRSLRESQHGFVLLRFGPNGSTRDRRSANKCWWGYLNAALSGLARSPRSPTTTPLRSSQPAIDRSSAASASATSPESDPSS